MTKPLPPEVKARQALERSVVGHSRRRGRAPSRRGAFYKRCVDRSCGTCIRCCRARQWREGKYANKRKSVRADAWPPEQDARLRQLAGTMDRREIAVVLTREFPDWPRSIHGTAVYASRNNISLWPPGRSLSEVGDLLGVVKSRVQSWVDLGWLEGFPYEYRSGPSTGHIRVRDEALECFIRRHPEHVNPARMMPSKLPIAQLARSLAARAIPVRFSKPHPPRRRPEPTPNVFGIACQACEQVTFSRDAYPTICRTCHNPFVARAA